VGGVVAAPGLERLRAAEPTGGEIVEIADVVGAVVAGGRLGEPVGVAWIRRQAQPVGEGRQPVVGRAGRARQECALLVVVVDDAGVRLIEGVA